MRVRAIVVIALVTILGLGYQACSPYSSYQTDSPLQQEAIKDLDNSFPSRAPQNQNPQFQNSTPGGGTTTGNPKLQAMIVVKYEPSTFQQANEPQVDLCTFEAVLSETIQSRPANNSGGLNLNPFDPNFAGSIINLTFGIINGVFASVNQSLNVSLLPVTPVGSVDVESDKTYIQVTLRTKPDCQDQPAPAVSVDNDYGSFSFNQAADFVFIAEMANGTRIDDDDIIVLAIDDLITEFANVQSDQELRRATSDYQGTWTTQ